MSAVDPAASAQAAASGPPPQLVVLQMLTGRWVTGAVTAAARFRLADHLAAQPRTAAELAPEIGAHAPSLYRLLRALASLGLFAADEQERFTVTPLGEQLRSDVPGTMYGMARLFGSEEHGAAWNALPYAVLESVPAADVLVLSRVLHDWSDADAERILRNCRAALPPHGRVAIVDNVIEPGDAPGFGKLLDLEMLVLTTGRERTREDFERLFAAAGLRLARVIPMNSGAIVEAVPALLRELFGSRPRSQLAVVDGQTKVAPRRFPAGAGGIEDTAGQLVHGWSPHASGPTGFGERAPRPPGARRATSDGGGTGAPVMV